MAQNSMNFQGSPLTAAVLGPDILARQLRLQQSQQYAQQMLEQGQQAPQGQMVSGHYVPPSITQYLANGLKSYMGRKTMDDMPKQMSELGLAQMQGINNMFGAGQPAQSTQSAQPLPVGASTGQPTPQDLASGLRGQPAGQPQMPLLPGRSPQDSARAYMMMGPAEYMKAVTSQGAPTDIQKNLIAQGVQPGSPQWNQALSGNVAKSNYIAPTSVAPGGTLIDPNTRQPVFSAQQNGIQTQYGPNGEATASQVPGFAQAQAGIAGAETAATEAAKAGLDLVNVPDGQGGTVQMPRSQAVQALGQGGAQPGAAGHTPPKQVLDARQDLPKVISQADSMISSIDGILSHPGLSSAVGLRVPGMTSMPGTEAANFQTRLDQLKGQAFLQAFQSLRGGGQITEVEGQKATDAIGRLNNNQSETEFKKSMGELRGILQSAKQRAYGMAQVPNEAPKQASADTAKPDRNALMQEARRRGLIK